MRATSSPIPTLQEQRKFANMSHKVTVMVVGEVSLGTFRYENER